MNHKEILDDQAEAFAEIFGEAGSLILSPFLDALIGGYEDKVDFRDFTPEERTEILLNAYRMMEILESPEDD